MDQLLLVYDDVYEFLESGSVVDVIMFDCSKAFDVVSHSTLLTKLPLLGSSVSLIRWIEDFLVGRLMTAQMKGKTSNQRIVTSEVP